MIRQGGVLGIQTPDYSPGMIMTNFNVAMEYIKMIKNTFGRGYQVQFNPNTEILTVNPPPTEAVTGVLYMYKKEVAENLYNNHHVKAMAVGKAKMVWGMNLKKYTLQMPDGITINGKEIREEGKEEFDTAFQMIRDETPGPDFFLA